MNNENFGLKINDDVIARMVEMAALETTGVAAMGVRPTASRLLAKKDGTKSVEVKNDNGILNVELYIKVFDNEKVSVIAERVQQSVKEKLQGMTGNAVTHVNVVVSDIAFTEDEKK